MIKCCFSCSKCDPENLLFNQGKPCDDFPDDLDISKDVLLSYSCDEYRSVKITKY